ncbi:hypothetical protein PIB30_106065, partial [Stylosanthes scabra]|nr:hypothetical protein [Stylosanthes scabra]
NHGERTATDKNKGERGGKHAAPRAATESRQAQGQLRCALDDGIGVERRKTIWTTKWRERGLHSSLPPAKVVSLLGHASSPSGDDE